MSDQTELGRQLYALLPEVYRNRDNSVRGNDGKITRDGDLARYLHGNAALLDRLQATLDQFLADAFPDQAPPGELSCQPWILPYLADLLDVRLVSPEPDGQRWEIAKAVSWRQGKGTLRVLEEAAEAVGQFEVEIQEGWRRLALTGRIGAPLLPATAFGESDEMDVEVEPPSRVARHPGLPSVTVDLRRASRAVRSEASNPAAKETRFDDQEVYWRQAHPHGAPCFPNSYEDASRRTADLRTIDWRRGHFHPRRVLLYLPPPAGFHYEGQVQIPWQDRDLESNRHLFETIESTRTRDGVKERVITYRGLGDGLLALEGLVALPDPETAPADVHRFEKLALMDGVSVTGARIELRGCSLSGIFVEGAARAGLDARDCLIGRIDSSAPVLLEYCTVLETTTAAALKASDCIFVQDLQQDASSPPDPHDSCIRYSALPGELGGFELAVYEKSCTSELPHFYSEVFGRRGCGVLHPSAPEAICSGAEDGGEIGAYHQQRYCRRWDTIRDKLGDFLPIRQAVVLIPDDRLLCAPPNTV